jgi:hypothetical protein
MDLAPQAIPAIWVYTSGDSFNSLRREGYGAFLTDAQKARIERIRQARMLFDGRHRDYFVDEGRTQFSFGQVRTSWGRGSQLKTMYLMYNVLGLISLKGADLLFGEEPSLRAEDDYQQQALSDLVERSSLHSLFYACAVDASYEAECFLEACVQRGAVYLRQVKADEIFPTGEPGPDLQFPSYERYNLQNVGTAQAAIWLLLVTTYATGSIERHVYQLDEQGGRRELSLDQWPLPAGADPLQPMVKTGMDRNTITWVPNMLVRGQPVSDYDGAIDLQDALNAKTSQIGRVLAKHSDPKIAFPEERSTRQGNVPQRLRGVLLPPTRTKIPQVHHLERRARSTPWPTATFALNQLLVRTETSPVLLGLKEGAAPDAYKKVRLESVQLDHQGGPQGGVLEGRHPPRGRRRAGPGEHAAGRPLRPRADRRRAAGRDSGGRRRAGAGDLAADDGRRDEPPPRGGAAAPGPGRGREGAGGHRGGAEGRRAVDRHGRAAAGPCRRQPATATGGVRVMPTIARLVLLVLAMVPEFSNSGVSQRELSELVKLYTGAQDRLRAIVENPQGRTQGAQEFRQARAAAQLSQVDQILQQLGQQRNQWIGQSVPQAYRDGITRADSQAKAAGVRPEEIRAVPGSFHQIDRDTVTVFARDIAADLAKAEGAIGENVKTVLRATAQQNLGEAEINRILAGGVIEGRPVATIKLLRDALQRVSGDQVTFPDKNGNPITFETKYYAELVARTKTRQATEHGRHNRLKRLGLDLVSITGALSGNFCTAFLGQVFSLGGGSAKYPALASLPGGGPPFHPQLQQEHAALRRDPWRRTSSSRTPDGLDDAKSLVGVDTAEAQRRYKDLQLQQQVQANYGKNKVL